MMIDIFYLIYQKRSALLVVLFSFSLLVGLLFLFLFRNVGPEEHRIPGTDYLEVYKPNTEYFLREGRLQIGNGREDGSIVPPGYPLFLVTSFVIASWLRVSELSVVIIMNVLVGSLSVLLLFLIAEHVFNRKVALLASLLWATYPISLWFLKNPHTEVPFIFFLLAATLTFLVGFEQNKIRVALAVGILLGIATLIRPIGLFLPVVFILIAIFRSWGLYWGKKIVFAAVLLGVYLMVLSPWIIYVFLNTEEFMLLGNYDTGSIEAGLMFAIRDHTLPIAVPEGVQRIMEEVRDKNFSTKSDFVEYGIQKLRSDPVPFLQLLLLKAVRSWYATAQGWQEETRLLVLQLFYLIPACIGVFYVMRTPVVKWSSLWLMLLSIGFFWFMTFSVLSIMRYMVPAMTFVMMFAAVFWVNFIPKVYETYYRNSCV